MKTSVEPVNYVSTTNACKACMPLGACLAFKGIEGAVPFLHGSQGCATYMRRYLISHFREPVDIASSCLGESQAVFGGGPNLKQGLVNVINKYQARLVGVATTCLTETIGDDLQGLIREFMAESKVEGNTGKAPVVVGVSTPSYSATHLEGFHAAVAAVVDALAREDTAPHGGVNLLPGFVSAADLRHLKGIMDLFNLKVTLLPDYSRTLDAPIQKEYEILPAGGTPIEDLEVMGGAAATIEFGTSLPAMSGGRILAERCSVPLVRLRTPMGLRATDAFFSVLQDLAGKPVPTPLAESRGRLLDSMVDGHKYLSGKKAVLYGEVDLVVALAGWLAEMGVEPVLCASGGSAADLERGVEEVTRGLLRHEPQVAGGVDFFQIAELARELKPDLMVGNSKGYRLSRELGVPLVRVGFPIHDRLGAQRLHHLGYQGSQEIFHRIVNAILAHQQDSSPVGYGYL